MAFEVRLYSEANDGTFYVWVKTNDRGAASEYADQLQARRRRNRVEVAEAA